jgi:hypothetical protein
MKVITFVALSRLRNVAKSFRGLDFVSHVSCQQHSQSCEIHTTNVEIIFTVEFTTPEFFV